MPKQNFSLGKLLKSIRHPVPFFRISAALILLMLFSVPLYAAILPDVDIQADLDRVFSEKIAISGYPYQEFMQKNADRYDLPLPFVLAVARGESFFNPNAKSSKGALGIMQVMPSTAQSEYGIPEQALWDPATNIEVGVHYLADLYRRFKDPYLTLAAYYCGPGGVNAQKGTVREDCNEYVRYIHTHLTSILARASGQIPTPRGKTEKLVVTCFDNYLDARDFLGFVNPRLKGLQLDMFRTEKQMSDHLRFQYQIIVVHGEETDKTRICRQLKEITGFSLCKTSTSMLNHQ